MRRVEFIFTAAFAAAILGGPCAGQSQMEKARARSSDLLFGTYATSRQVEQLATDETVRARTFGVIRNMGITKLYLEVYRSGHVVSAEHLIYVRDVLRDRNIAVVGGIATVPGGGFGVRQQGSLGWFNWQNEKTRRDLEKVIRMAAGVFDTFIVDDFLCTGDVSEESKAAKGNRPWDEYRRALITEVARSVLVGPAKEVNPGITMIVKYPQWYDRFHLFGYDVVTLPQIFDEVWVGTETRGRGTQRFGFVQPYEGFVNYRWLAGIGGPKAKGAWFDHGDCGEHDFLDQAYTSVLAGAPELVFFNLGNLLQGHPDHEKMVGQFDRLADLASAVRSNPITGVPAYKPPNSDPAGDMYLMDFLGMLGIPIIPVHEFPEAAPTIFLPAQAAADLELLGHVKKALARGANVVVTTSLVVAARQGEELARLAGIGPGVESKPLRARLISSSGENRKPEAASVPIDLESPIEAKDGEGDIACWVGDSCLALLTIRKVLGGSVALLNTHTYSQADFDAVGEVLLCPRPLGLLSMNGPSLAALRAAFGNHVTADGNVGENTMPELAAFDGPTCVTFHPFAPNPRDICVVQNFNDEPVHVAVTVPARASSSFRFVDAFTDRIIASHRAATDGYVVLDFDIGARGRIWLRCKDRYNSRCIRCLKCTGCKPGALTLSSLFERPSQASS